MKKKALLVAAQAGTIGPFVVLDEGMWEIPSHPFVALLFEGQTPVHENGVVRVRGKARVRASVIEEADRPVHLDASLVLSNA